jgi:hypothetical protein
MAFVSTLGKVSSNQRTSVARFPRLRLAEVTLGAVAARAAAVPRRRMVHLNGMGDMGRAAARSISRSAPTIRWRLRGLGETSCTIDPATGGRVCTSGPAAPAAAAASSCTSITPRYLPDPTTQQWAWDNPMSAAWIFTGRPDVNSVYDMYVRQDGQAFAAVGPGGGFMYNDPRRATVPAYGPCVQPAAAPAPVPVPTTPAPVIDSSGQPMTIQPATPASSLPSPMVATTLPAMVPTSGGLPWGKIALYGGLGIGALLVLRMVGVIKK